jgi:SAM-dependent methyltransferase
MVRSVDFKLPPKGAFTPNGNDDPLKYYYIPFVGSLYISRVRMALNLLENQRFGNTLEIGYGSGVLMPTLCKISQQVYGVDLTSDPELVSKQLSQFGCAAELSRGECDRLLFGDRTFDLIVAISVLEHIRDIESFLTEIYRVLKPGGVLLVGMPAVNKFMEYLFSAIGFPGIANHHVTSPEEMLVAATPMFTLKANSQMPGFFPSRLYLYKTFRLEK